MKNLLLTSALFLVTFFALSQGSYTSQDNKKANWETASIWTKQYTWMAAAPPGPSDVGGSYVVNIYGVVTRNGNLTFSGGSTLNVYDTLIIRGNFTVASSVVVQPGGVLIVLGDFIGTSSSSNKLTNNGNVVVTGDFSNSGGPITTNNKVYSFDTTPTFSWGSSIDGVSYNGNNTNGMASHVKSKAQLNSQNASLANYVNTLLGTLPVKLISFKGSFENHASLLSWTTAKEEGFDHFEIERASGELVFEKIGQVNGVGYSTEDEHAYSFTDNSASSGVNYYRLKSLDADGSFEYSSIVSTLVESSKSVSVYPNPSNGDFVNVSATFELSNDTQILIFNQEGVMLEKIQVTERHMQINFTNHLTTGVYILKYTTGKYSETVRLFVK